VILNQGVVTLKRQAAMIIIFILGTYIVWQGAIIQSVNAEKGNRLSALEKYVTMNEEPKEEPAPSPTDPVEPAEPEPSPAPETPVNPEPNEPSPTPAEQEKPADPPPSNGSGNGSGTGTVKPPVSNTSPSRPGRGSVNEKHNTYQPQNQEPEVRQETSNTDITDAVETAEEDESIEDPVEDETVQEDVDEKEVEPAAEEEKKPADKESDIAEKDRAALKDVQKPTISLVVAFGSLFVFIAATGLLLFGRFR